MTEAITKFFRELVGNDILTIIIIAIIPIIELRGAIPIAVSMGMGLGSSFLWAWLGSSLVVPILLLLLKPILELMKKARFFNRFANAMESMFREKAEIVAKKAEKKNAGKGRIDRVLLFKLIGVFTFVALPLPLTGVWTGSAVAVFLGIPFFPALVAILLGNATAGGIVTLLSYFFEPYIDTILMVFFVIVVLVLVLYIVKIALKMKHQKKAEKSKNTTKNIEMADAEVADGENSFSKNDNLGKEVKSKIEGDLAVTLVKNEKALKSDENRKALKSDENRKDLKINESVKGNPPCEEAGKEKNENNEMPLGENVVDCRNQGTPKTISGENNVAAKKESFDKTKTTNENASKKMVSITKPTVKKSKKKTDVEIKKPQ